MSLRDKTMDVEERYLARAFQRFPIVAVRGKGALLWDVDGKSYVDCMGGYGVALVGHCHPDVVEAVKEQVERLISCHYSLYNDARARALETLEKIAPKGLSRVFLSNSGAESVECALKLALRYTGRKDIVAMTGSFHGKTLGALSVTYNKKYRLPFEHALYQRVKFAKYGDPEDAIKLITDETAAVIVEPIQGESGIRVPPEDFLVKLREATSKSGCLLIADEVQSGLGRTGKMWACEHWEIVPDILCVAKGMAGGIPIGATFATDEVMGSLKTGEHSSTFGGNPIACAAADATINVILKESLVERAAEMGAYFKDRLTSLHGSHRILREVRGKGLMLAAEMRVEIYEVLMELIRRGVVPLYSGKNILRLLPPLVIEKEQVDLVIESLDAALAEEELRVAEAGRGISDKVP
ncbi:MAG: aspartate aminotransferase family protein [Candidatus Bathyarchaeia archaeon]